MDVEREISFLLQKHQQHYYEWHVFMLTSRIFFLSELHCNTICIYKLCQSLACIDLRDIYSEMKILIWYLVNYITRSSEESIGSDIHVITRTRMNSSVRLLEYTQTAAHLRWIGWNLWKQKYVFKNQREKIIAECSQSSNYMKCIHPVYDVFTIFAKFCDALSNKWKTYVHISQITL